MDRIFQYIVKDSDLPCKVGEYLRTRGVSRQILIQLKKTPEGILLNGEWAYVRSPLSPGDRLQISLKETQASPHILPVSMELSILYEDQDLMIVNKPSDMPVHPSINNYDNTLANGAAFYFARQGQPFVFRCINRLDRDTTGLLILAKNALSASILSAQMKERKIRRTYLAVVQGNLLPRSGTVRAPIARLEGSAIQRQVDFSKGQTAVTHYQVLRSLPDRSLVRLNLETGRTHQIRVHMKYLNHPLLGDFLYAPGLSQEISRTALHSFSLSFTHPCTGEPLYFQAPLPGDMEGLFPKAEEK